MAGSNDTRDRSLNRGIKMAEEKKLTTGEVFVEINEKLGTVIELLKALVPTPPLPPIEIRNLPYYIKRDLVSGGHHTEDIKDDEEQGLGTKARAGIVENMNVAGMSGTLILKLFDGDDWSEEIPIPIAGKFTIRYNDNITVQKAELTASGGPIRYKLLMAPGGA